MTHHYWDSKTTPHFTTNCEGSFANDLMDGGTIVSSVFIFSKTISASRSSWKVSCFTCLFVQVKANRTIQEHYKKKNTNFFFSFYVLEG